MAKKTIKKEKLPANLRYGDVTIDELEIDIQRLQVIDAEMKASIYVLKSLGISTINTDGATMRRRGVELLDQFSTHLQVAIVKAKKDKKTDN